MDRRAYLYRVGPHADQRDDVLDELGELFFSAFAPQTVNRLRQRTRTGEFSVGLE